MPQRPADVLKTHQLNTLKSHQNTALSNFLMRTGMYHHHDLVSKDFFIKSANANKAQINIQNLH